MKPDDKLLNEVKNTLQSEAMNTLPRLTEIKASVSNSEYYEDYRMLQDIRFLISQVETLTAEKEKLVDALVKILDEAANSFDRGSIKFQSLALEALASVQKEAE